MARRQALLRDSAARRSGALPAPAGSPDGPLGAGAEGSPSGGGSRWPLMSDEEAGEVSTAAPGQAGPYANRLIVLTKRLEVGLYAILRETSHAKLKRLWFESLCCPHQALRGGVPCNAHVTGSRPATC